MHTCLVVATVIYMYTHIYAAGYYSDLIFFLCIYKIQNYIAKCRMPGESSIVISSLLPGEVRTCYRLHWLGRVSDFGSSFLVDKGLPNPLSSSSALPICILVNI